MSAVRKTLPIFEKRKQYNGKLRDDLRNTQGTIKRLEKTIENLTITSSAGKDLEWTASQISTARQRIIHFTDEVVKIQTKLSVVIEGGCDNEIESMFKVNIDQVTEMTEKKAKREAYLSELDEKDHQRSSAFSKSEYQEMKNERYMKKVWEREFERYTEVSSQLPEYIIKSLVSMPNNKGYKWRGIIFYGYLPDDNGPSVIFEKKPDGTIISESTSTSFNEWFKPRDGQKQLLRSHGRKLNPRAPATIINSR